MNDVNPYKSGAARRNAQGLQDDDGETLLAWAFLAVVASLAIVFLAAWFGMQDRVAGLLCFPPLAGIIFSLLATRLRAWRGFLIGAAVGALFGFIERDLFNFGMGGGSVEVRIWMVCICTCCLGFVGALLNTFALNKARLALATIALVAACSVLFLLLALFVGSQSSPRPPDVQSPAAQGGG